MNAVSRACGELFFRHSGTGFCPAGSQFSPASRASPLTHILLSPSLSIVGGDDRLQKWRLPPEAREAGRTGDMANNGESLTQATKQRQNQKFINAHVLHIFMKGMTILLHRLYRKTVV